MTELYLLEVNRIVEWGPQIRPTRAVVDLDAILANAEKLSTLAGCPLLAVVKADAYGHGATTVSLALESMFRANPTVLKGFAVSLLEEGIELREAGVTMPILVMGPSLMDAHSLIVDFDLMPMVSDVRHLEPISEAARRSEKVLGIHLKVDTGMGRLGLAPEELAAALELVNSLKGLELRGIASHLACADTDDPEDQSAMSAEQLRRFAELARQDKSLDQGQLASKVQFHVANSAAILRFPTSRYDLARPGLALYGNGGTADDGLTGALRFVSEVSQVRLVPTGESVSYGARWTAARDSTVAIVPLGYADGLPRRSNLEGRATVLIGGHRCPILGTVSMDMIVVDITDHQEVRLGDEVVVLGQQGGDCISVAEIAKLCGISEYEVSCGISKRVPRRYVSENG